MSLIKYPVRPAIQSQKPGSMHNCLGPRRSMRRGRTADARKHSAACQQPLCLQQRDVLASLCVR
ncbi:hypothetical protein C2E23DRAFT_821065, partial [Lenzites betulinus]